MDITEAFTAAANAITAVSTEVTQRDAENNTLEMRQAAALAKLGLIIDAHRLHIKNHDLENFRKDVAAPVAGGVPGA